VYEGNNIDCRSYGCEGVRSNSRRRKGKAISEEEGEEGNGGKRCLL
jgi:hypothetical protein